MSSTDSTAIAPAAAPSRGFLDSLRAVAASGYAAAAHIVQRVARALSTEPRSLVLLALLALAIVTLVITRRA